MRYVKAPCDETHWTEVNVKLVLRVNDKVLILHRINGNYIFPSDPVNWGEPLLEVLGRELQKEPAHGLAVTPEFFDLYEYIASDAS